MDFTPTEREQALAAAARAYATGVLAGRADARDRTAAFPEEEMRELARRGLVGLTVPSALGGAGASAVGQVLAMEEIAQADAAVAVTLAVTSLVAEVICRFGSPAQQRTFVPRITSGAALAASFAVSEAQAGSDLASMTTTAVRTPTGWRLDGEKAWITSGDRAGVVVVGARTDPTAGKKGISAFLVPAGTPGLRAGPPEEKMGQRGSSTVPLRFEGCALPEEALLGELGGGLPLIYTTLDYGRIGIAALAIGIGRAALSAAARYAQQRVQFGAPIASFQAIQFPLADAATELEGAHLLTLAAADARDRGRPLSRASAMAKLAASEAAGRACDVAIQILGATGYTRRAPVERLARDVRVTRIYEGTSEVQRIVIARSLLEELALPAATEDSTGA